jgi:hypothetical protein
LRFQRRVRRTRQGDFELRLAAEERDVLRSLPAQIREVLASSSGSDDPAIARLNPTAYPDDPEFDAEYHRLMREDLDAGRLAALQTLEETVDARRLDEPQALAWLRALNDMRLLVGTRLDVSEDPAERVVSPRDPRAPALALYDYLSVLEQDLVEALGE